MMAFMFTIFFFTNLFNFVFVNKKITNENLLFCTKNEIRSQIVLNSKSEVEILMKRPFKFNLDSLEIPVINFCSNFNLSELKHAIENFGADKTPETPSNTNANSLGVNSNPNVGAASNLTIEEDPGESSNDEDSDVSKMSNSRKLAKQKSANSVISSILSTPKRLSRYYDNNSASSRNSLLFSAPIDLSSQLSNIEYLELLSQNPDVSIYRVTIFGWTCAAKVFNTTHFDADQLKAIENEIKILSKLSSNPHKNIVRYLGNNRHIF